MNNCGIRPFRGKSAAPHSVNRRPVRILALVLALLVGLSACGTAAGGSAVSGASAAQTAAKTEAALADIAALGRSPDDSYRTWYEIFVYSFCDSNGDGIGDLKGVESKLDYLQTLGVTGIWLMPICPSPSYHKYDVTDYKAIDPAYGTMEDFDSLTAACHARGIRIILDLVVNHTSSRHTWFIQASDYLKTLPAGAQPDPAACPYVDYYNFVPTEEAGTGCAQLAGTDWSYECPFTADMPDLNWDSEDVRAEVKDIMAFWLGKGADGFRLDAAKEYYSGNNDKNIEALSWLETTARGIDPDAYLVAEVWSDFGTVTNYYASGITSIFDYPFGNSDGQIIKALRGAGQAGAVNKYAKNLEKAEAAYRAENPDFIDAPFLSNHDTGRIAGFVSGDENKMKLAGAMNLFMGGSAFIYYGEELGMPGSGNDPSKRAPMLWNDARSDGTTNPPPECTLPESYPLGSLETQQGDDGSIYNYYRQAIAIRAALPVIARGVSTAETALNSGCVSAVRKTGADGACILLYNIDENTAAVDLSAYEGWGLAASLSADGETVALENGTLTLPAYGAAVLTQKN